MLEQGQQADLMAVLQATIDTLQGQLEVKDRQIEQRLTITRLYALIAAQQTAAAAAGTSCWDDAPAASFRRGRSRSAGSGAGTESKAELD